jgi:hypothetical protein
VLNGENEQGTPYIIVGGDPAAEGRNAARIELHNDAEWPNGLKRVELQHQPDDARTAEGATTFFAWSFYLPETLPEDPSQTIGYWETAQSYQQMMAFDVAGESITFSTRPATATATPRAAWAEPTTIRPARPTTTATTTPVPGATMPPTQAAPRPRAPPKAGPARPTTTAAAAAGSPPRPAGPRCWPCWPSSVAAEKIDTPAAHPPELETLASGPAGNTASIASSTRGTELRRR